MPKRKTKKQKHMELLAMLLVIVGLAAIIVAVVLSLEPDDGKKPSDSDQTSTTSTVATTVTTTTKPDKWAQAKQLPYYIPAYEERYAILQMSNPEVALEEIILRVNMQLDHAFYTDTAAIQNPDSLLVLCNKYYYLSSSYVPDDLVSVAAKNTRNGAKLRKEANDAFAKLCADAAKEGIEIRITTAYRGYSFQKTLYDRYVKNDGKAAADTYSARPGYSEHQTGLAMDLGGKTPSGTWDLSYFDGTDAYHWMQKHAADYGFILRFPKDKVAITGYQYEPWHYRYVGVDVARVIWDEDLCLEEYWAKYRTSETN